MTLGLAEIYLIPKALWERITTEDLQLTVWFNTAGQAVAYKWDQRETNEAGRQRQTTRSE